MRKQAIAAIIPLALLCGPSAGAQNRSEQSNHPHLTRFSFGIPTQGEGSTYCTIQQNGSYDITLRDQGGNAIAVLDRVCAQYRESRLPSDPPRPARHIFATNWEINVLSSSVRMSLVQMQTEFFQKGVSPPTRSFLSTPTPRVGASWRCTSSRINANYSDTENEPNPAGPDILSNAAGQGMIYITGSYYSC